MTFSLGAIPSPHDSRDYVVTASAPQAYKPTMLSPLPETKDQGSTGSCVAHAASSVKEHYVGYPCSTEFLYGLRFKGYWQGAGMYMRDVLNTLTKYGECSYEECPGNVEMPQAKTNIMGVADSNQWLPFGFTEEDESTWTPILKKWLGKASPRKIKSYARCMTADAIKTAFDNEWPIIFVIGINNYYPDPKTFIFRPNGDSAGLHAVSGWGWDYVNGEECVHTLNSWGKKWGDNGWCWMTFEEVLRKGEVFAIADVKQHKDIRRTLKLIPKPRMTGEDVKLAQTLLNKHGAGIEVDGIFGPATDSAVKAFQKKRGLTADGVIGQDTWNALEEDPVEPTPDPDNEDIIKDCTAFIYQQIGQLYVWGGDGDREITEKTVRNMETSDANAERVIKHWKQMIADGITDIKGYDCSGLISRFLEDHGIVESKRNSNHLWNMCTPITREEMREGDLAFRQKSGDNYHVGYCPGGGFMIEAKGRDDGVIIRGIDADKGYWTHYGRPRWKEWI